MAQKPSQHDMARASRTLGGHLPYPEQDAERNEKARWTAQRWDAQDASYEAFYQTWSEIIAFMRGRQWDRWSPGLRAMVPEAKVAKWRQRLVSNYTFAIWKTFVAKLTKNRPAWEVRASSTDPQDINAAKLARDLLEWLWTNELKMGRIWRRVVGWVVASGNCWIEVFWDTNTGNMVDLTVPIEVPDPQNPGNFLEMEVAADEEGNPRVDPLTGMPEMDPETGEPVQPDEADMGQVGIAIHPPFAVRPNPEAFGDPDAVTDVMIGIVVSRDWFARVYGDEVGEGAVDWGNLGSFQNAMATLESMSTGGHRDAGEQMLTASTENLSDSTLLIRHYHKPDSEYPDGRFWVAASNGVMVEDEQPLPLGIWPLVHVTAYPNPGLSLSASPLEPVIPLNRRLNEQNSKIAEHESVMVQGKWLVPKTANLRKGAITSEPGEVIEYTPPFEPKMADMKALPAAVYNEREITKGDIEFVSGIRKISFGQPPPGVTAGKAFLVLQEADDTDLGPILASLSDALSDVGYLALWTIRHFYDEARVVASSSSETGEWMYRDFVGMDLDPVGRGGLALQVKVQEGSMFPWLKAASQEVALQLLQTNVASQLLTDEKTGGIDKRRLSQLLTVGGLENVIDDTDIDVAEAERVYNDLVRFQGNEPLPEPVEWQNIPIHYERFSIHLKSASFGGVDPFNQQLIFRYYQQLGAILAEQQAGEAGAAMQQVEQAKEAEAFGEEAGKLRAQKEIGIPIDPNKQRPGTNNG